jgi:hypothetical protein
MRSKLLRILVRTLLFGMFLLIPASVYADAFSLAVANLNNIQITSSGGNITFGAWQARGFATAGHNLEPLPLSATNKIGCHGLVPLEVHVPS